MQRSGILKLACACFKVENEVGVKVVTDLIHLFYRRVIWEYIVKGVEVGGGVAQTVRAPRNLPHDQTHVVHVTGLKPLYHHKCKHDDPTF